MSILSPWRGRVWARGDAAASVASVPNLISVVRVLLTPVFVWMFLADDGALGVLRIGATALFIVLIATDFLDGYLARSRNLVTDFGKLVDPIADKVITGAAFVVLTIVGELPLWVTALVLLREVGVTVHRLTLAKHAVVPASMWGKAKTMAQAIALPMAMLPLWLVFGQGWHVVNTVAMSLVVVLTVVSGLEYFWHVYGPRRAK